MVASVIAAFLYLRIMVSTWMADPDDGERPSRAASRSPPGWRSRRPSVFTLVVGIFPEWLPATAAETTTARLARMSVAGDSRQSPGGHRADDAAPTLRRMKAVATGLLVLAAVVFLVANANEDGRAWVGYVRAGAEAAMVGALADWFAVTALFRHPLGIPIPHTAIIPRRKDQIGRSLGEFVQGNFLTREVLMARLEGVESASGSGAGSASPSTPSGRRPAIADALRGAIEVLDDRDVQEAIGGARRAAAAVDATWRRCSARPSTSPSRAATTSACSTPCSRAWRSFLDDNRGTLRGRLDRSRRGGCPSRSTTASSTRSSPACSASSPTCATTPTTRCAASIDARVRALAERLRDDPVLIAKAEELKHELLSHPEVQAWLQSLWGELKRAILDGADDPDSELRRRLDAGSVQPAGDWPTIASCRPRSTTGSSASSSTSSRTTAARSPTSSPRRSSAGTAADTSGASSCRSAATSSSSASTARSSAASPAWPSTPSAS